MNTSGNRPSTAPARSAANLAPYVARGFGPLVDHDLANTPVKGIDRAQAQSIVRLCPDIERELYEGTYSPRQILYRAGSRPALEGIVGPWRALPPRQQAARAMEWVRSHVVHPHLAGRVAGDRALGEEQLIESGIGYCNEQSRVFVALCEVLQIPGRLCFLFHRNGRCGHVAAELYVDGKWSFHDTTFNLRVELAPDGTLASAADLLRDRHRELSHRAYRPALRSYFAACLPFVENCPGWRSADRPSVDAGGDLLGQVGICNYLIDGAERAGDVASP